MSQLHLSMDTLQEILTPPARNNLTPISAGKTPEARKIMDKLNLIFESATAAKAAGIDFATFADAELRSFVSSITNDVLEYQLQ
jgi:hypothetical protein